MFGYSLIYLILSTIFTITFSIQSIILLLWVIVLFNSSIQFRRKAKYFSILSCNQDAILEAINSKVEYRKYLLLFAIVLFEFVSCIFSFNSYTEVLIFSIGYIGNYSVSHNETIPNHSRNMTNECNISVVTPFLGSYLNENARVLFASIGIPLILTFSLVYTLMSYYVMITKKSLSYNISLKSVDLAREQKILLLTSSVASIILMLLLVRIEVYVLFHIIESSVAILQSYLTAKYSIKLVRIIKWKILDTKIAFGEDHYLFKSYTKSLKKFKLFASIYNIVVNSFCLYTISRACAVLLLFLYPNELFQVYDICIHVLLSSSYFNVLNYLIHIVNIFEKVPLLIFQVSLFVLNLFTVPYLFSEMNSCHINCYKSFRSQQDRHLREPFLN
ncbi:hypothetical protein LOD99_7599 [Oopsacas minuta]|uniref:Uncharacterized protein n=1 Tax=Oopsacas minuta TaxID=111878 RepID=A0AAV7JP14_9METZ|nr:hypothetical protein LOD99_7599 [Oopsacas minuta]